LFYYDAFGRRETFDDFGLIMSYLYDKAMAVQETSSNTSIVPIQNYLTTPNGEILAYSATAGSTTTAVPLRDVRGSTIGLVNSSGSLATQFSYEPFGAVTASGAASTYPYLFAGMEYDEGTGLYHTPARYYSPRLQRFLTEDPLGFGGGDVNFLAYVANDPVNATDPSGLQEVPGGYCAYGYAGPAVTPGGFNNGDGFGFAGTNASPSFGSDVAGSIGIGGPSASGGLGHISSAHGFESVGQTGIDPSQIILSQYTVKLPPGTDPQSAELGIMAIGGPDAELAEEAAIALKAMGRPAWAAQTAAGFIE